MTSRAKTIAARLPVGRTQLHWLAYYARRGMARIDNAEVRSARTLLRVMRTTPPDVLYLGDSAVSFISPADQDRRRLFEMVDGDLGADVTMQVVHGGSYHPAIYDAFLHMVSGSASRPVVIVPLCVRVRTLPWIEHPIFGLKQATRFIAAADPSGPAWRVRASFPRPTAADFATFHAVPHHTWAGELTVGDYIARLKSPAAHGLDEAARVKLLYAYHHGGAVADAAAHLAAVTRLGRRLRELGITPVVYQTPVPVQEGSAYHGPDFHDLTARNFTLLDKAYRDGYGADAKILQTGTCFETDEFVDPRDASEHLNERGRQHLTDVIVPEVTLALDAQRKA